MAYYGDGWRLNPPTVYTRPGWRDRMTLRLLRVRRWLRGAR